VRFETDEGLGKGEFRCEASLVEGPDRPLTGEMQAIGKSNTPGQLILLQDGRPVRTYVLNKEVVALGRLSECDIVISDPGASRRHAEIRRENGRFVLTDLGSTNGTQVNESTVSERDLEEGDRITIGHTVLEFRRG
jgi:pSer/pThr/pTyr-binding forkhead associated (FHA) protein